MKANADKCHLLITNKNNMEATIEKKRLSKIARNRHTI